MRLKVNQIISSTLVMLFSFLVIRFLKLGLLIAGAKISGLDSEIMISNLMATVISENWSVTQLLFVYLLPFLVMVILAFIVGIKYNYPVKYSKLFVLVKSWMYVFLIIEAFLLPIASILIKSVVYHPLSMIGFSRFEQYLVAIILFVFYLIGSAKSGPFFAARIEHCKEVVTEKSCLVTQVLALIVVPAIGLILTILACYGFNQNLELTTFIAGLIFSLGLTVWQIVSYDVIIK